MNEIEVYHVERDEIVMILADDFDPKIHRELKGKQDAQRSGEGEGDDLSGTITEAAGEIGKAVREAVQESLKDVTKSIDRSKVGGQTIEGEGRVTVHDPIDETSRAYGEALRARPGFERQYDRLPADEQKVRSPEGDMQVWRWARAIANHDPSTTQEVLREIQAARMPKGSSLTEIDRQMSTGAGSGGPLVPVPLADAIAVKRDKRERIAPLSARFTSEGEQLRLPAEGTVLTGAGVAQNATVGPEDPTFAELVLTKKKWGVIAVASNELLMYHSSAFSLVNVLSNQAARSSAAYMDRQSAALGDGTGTNHTLALEQDGNIAVIDATVGALQRSDVVALKLGLPSEWRDGTNPYFMGNQAMTGYLSNVVDTTGRPIYNFQNNPATTVGDVGANVVGLVEGVPYIEVPFAADGTLMIGVLEEGFAVLDDMGMRIDTSTHGTYFTNDQVGYRFIMSRDSGVWLADAFRQSNGITAPT